MAFRVNQWDVDKRDKQLFGQNRRRCFWFICLRPGKHLMNNKTRVTRAKIENSGKTESLKANVRLCVRVSCFIKCVVFSC